MLTAEIIIIVVCLLMAAFFSSSEIAYNMVAESRLEKKAEEEGKLFYRLAYKIKHGLAYL